MAGQARELAVTEITAQVPDGLHNDGHYAAGLEDAMEATVIQRVAGERASVPLG